MFIASRFPRPDRPSRIGRSAIEPLSENRFAIEFTGSGQLRDKLELCRDLMSHVNPSRDLAVVIERAVDLLLADLERSRLARTRRPQRGPKARASGIASTTRRAVFERDGLQCTFVAENGRRCEARAFLELDHAAPKALGGGNDVHNLRVRCRAHNQLWAEQVFGRERVDRSRHFCQKKCTKARGECAQTTVSGVGPDETQVTLEKLRLALRGMGFREAETRKAIATITERHAGDEAFTIEGLLREAVLVATAA